MLSRILTTDTEYRAWFVQLKASVESGVLDTLLQLY